MECLRKAGEESKESNDRMPTIVEAGALAVATTVKPHGLTSNNDITTPIASFPKEDFIGEEPYSSLPVPNMSSPGNTNIQHKLNRSLLLMILFATSGFVMWNGKKLRALHKKRKEKEDIVFKWNGKEHRLSPIHHDEHDIVFKWNGNERSLSSILVEDKANLRSLKKFRLCFWYSLYSGELKKKGDGEFSKYRDPLMTNFSLDHLSTVLDSYSKLCKSVKPYFRPYAFFHSLTTIESLWFRYVGGCCKHRGMQKKLKKLEDQFGKPQSLTDEEKGVFRGRILEYMKEFSNVYSEFSTDKFKEEYFIWPEDMYPETILTYWNEVGKKK